MLDVNYFHILDFGRVLYLPLWSVSEGVWTATNQLLDLLFFTANILILNFQFKRSEEESFIP